MTNTWHIFQYRQPAWPKPITKNGTVLISVSGTGQITSAIKKSMGKSRTTKTKKMVCKVYWLGSRLHNKAQKASNSIIHFGSKVGSFIDNSTDQEIHATTKLSRTNLHVDSFINQLIILLSVHVDGFLVFLCQECCQGFLEMGASCFRTILKHLKGIWLSLDTKTFNIIIYIPVCL